MFSNARGLMITGGMFTDQHQHYSTRKTAIDRLMEASSLGALHNSGERFDPPKCHPNTRTAVLEKLMDWFIGKVGWDMFVLWLYGPAGAGKSAIAQTFAEQCSITNGLLASFFFSRSDPKRNNEKALVATLAYQVSQRIPGLWTILEPIINQNPAIFQLNFETQFQTLILNPLLELSNTGLFTSGESLPYVFIIDGLDECEGSNVQKTILNTISNALQRHRFTLPFMFLFASRPEHHLTTQFNDVSLNNLTLRLALDDTYQPDTDIRLYLVDSFHNIRQTHVMAPHLPDSWPSEDDITQLVTKSSGQFIYAAMVIRYVSSPRHSPLNRLKVVHGLLPVNNDKPYAELDALYFNILADVEDIEATLRVLGVSLVTDDFNIDDLEWFMLLDPGSIQLLLLDLVSVVDTSDHKDCIKFLHASFGDFLLDPTRSLQFHINLNQMHGEATRLCIAQINSFWNSDITDIIAIQPMPYMLHHAIFFVCDHLRATGPLHNNVTLRADILSVFYVQTLQVCDVHWPDCFENLGPGYLGAEFLTFLQTSTFTRTEELYLHHRGVWDQIMHQSLALVPKSNGLAFWAACLASIKDYYIDLDTIMALPSPLPTSAALLYVPFYLLIGENHQTMTFDGERHRIESQPDYKYLDIDPDHSAIVAGFLIDPARAGPYTVNESTYTMAAEFVVAFAVRPWDEKKKRIGSGSCQWDLIWDAIICILPKAGWSNKLVDVLNNQSLTFVLGRPDKDVQVKLQTMFHAVSGYLLRRTGFIPARFHIVIDWTKWKWIVWKWTEGKWKLIRVHKRDSGEKNLDHEDLEGRDKNQEDPNEQDSADDGTRTDIPFYLNSTINN